jgi:hypothetical protein
MEFPKSVKSHQLETSKFKVKLILLFPYIPSELFLQLIFFTKSILNLSPNLSDISSYPLWQILNNMKNIITYRKYNKLDGVEIT